MKFSVFYNCRAGRFPALYTVFPRIFCALALLLCLFVGGAGSKAEAAATCFAGGTIASNTGFDAFADGSCGPEAANPFLNVNFLTTQNGPQVSIAAGNFDVNPTTNCAAIGGTERQVTQASAICDVNGLNNVTVVFSLVENGQNYTVTYSNVTDNVANFSVGSITVAGGVFDDPVAPRIASIVRQTPAAATTNADSLTWRVTFDETVVNVDATDFSVVNSTGAVNVAAVSGSVYDVSVSGGDVANFNGAVRLELQGGQNIADAVGNDLANTTPTGANEDTYTLDNTAPTVTVSGVPGVTDGATPFTATYTFNEAVTGFDLTDAQAALSNAAAGAFTAVSATVYTAQITPNGGGNVSVGVNGGAATDAAGNGNTAATPQVATLDASAPTVAVSGVPGVTDGATPFTATYTFNEAVTGFDLTDAQAALSNAAAGAFTAVSATVYTAQITPNGGGNVSVGVNGGAANDAAGNGNTAATPQVATLDASAPTVGIAAPASADGPFQVTATFSETVTGFAAGDVVLSAGAVSNFDGAANPVFTFTVTPPSTATPTASLTIDIPAAAATDGAGNPNAAAAQVVVQFTDQQAVRARSKKVVGNFVSERGRRVARAIPSLAGIARQGAFNSNGLDWSAAFTKEAQDAAFSLDLRALKQKLSDDPYARNAQSLLSFQGLNMWAEGAFTRSVTEADKTNVATISVGLDRPWGENLTIGVFAQSDWSSQDARTQNYSIDGWGFLAAPYLVARLDEGVYLEMLVGGGGSENTISPLPGISDEFTTIRLVSRSALTGETALGSLGPTQFHFRPRLDVLYYWERQQAYRDSFGGEIESRAHHLGQVTLEPSLRALTALEQGGLLSAELSVSGSWLVAEYEDALAAESAAPDDVQLGLQTALGFQSPRGVIFNGSAYFEGVSDDQYRSFGGRLTVRLPFQ